MGGIKPEQTGDGSSVFESLLRKKWAGQFRVTHGEGSHLTQSITEVTLSSSKSLGRKFCEPWLKKYTWLVYNRDSNFMYCKLCTKAKKSNGSPRAEIFKVLRVFVLLVFKNTGSEAKRQV